MKKAALFITIIIILSTCSKPVENLVDPLTTDEIDDAALWSRITVETDYKSYSFWPGHEDIQPGQSPHGVYHKIYINRALADALPIPDRISPVGTIIVKENLSSERVVDAITVMVKVKDYNPEAGDWFWAKFTPQGEVLAEGTPKGCVSCHEGMDGNDYIIVRMLDSDPDS